MAELMSLTLRGRGLVDDDFLSGVRATGEVGQGHAVALERAIDLAAVDRAVEACVTEYEPGDTRMDGVAAVAIHKALRLTPREASDLGVWHWLAVVHAPAFVRHRWAHKNGVVARERFLGSVVRNTFARLWWGAQLTVRDDDYKATKLVFKKSQDQYENVFGRAFSWYPEAVHAFLEVVGNESEQVFRETAKQLHHVLTTVVLECLSQEEIEALLKEIVREVKAGEPTHGAAQPQSPEPAGDDVVVQAVRQGEGG